MRGLLSTIQHQSEALRGNCWGDPSLRDVVVYEPAGASGEMPALLALPAFTSSHWGFLNKSWRSENLPERLERLTQELGLGPVRIFMPDCMTFMGGSQFLDSAGMGHYGTWIATELMPWLAERFPTTKWGAFGKSSGAYGAFRLPLDHPGCFQAIAAHAPDAGFEVVYPPDFPGAVETLRQVGGIQAWLKDWGSRRGVKGADHSVANLLAMACCYSPNLESPNGGLPADLPVDLDTAEVIEAVMARWMTHDIVPLVQQRPTALQGTAIWLDVGRRDEYRLQVGARRLHRAVQAAGLSSHYEEHAGGHFKLNDRFDGSLPFLVRALYA